MELRVFGNEFLLGSRYLVVFKLRWSYLVRFRRLSNGETE